MRARIVVTLLSLLMLAAPAVAQEKVKAVASFSIIGDLVKQVGGDMLDLTVLVGPDSDAHVYSPSPSDAKAVADAKIMFVNGLGFEGWIARLVKASGTKGLVVVASQGIKPRRTDDGRQHGQAHGHPESDPHAWQSVANAKMYVANIREGLMRVDPANRTAYETNAAKYLTQLEALEREITDEVARIPAERRRIFTSHDAFGYFKAAYGIDFIAPQGVSTESEASAQDVARIITQIKRQKIPAVFLENVTDSRMIKRIAAETGARIGGTLYSDALTDEKGAAPTYIDMIRHNLRTLSAALSS